MNGYINTLYLKLIISNSMSIYIYIYILIDINYCSPKDATLICYIIIFIQQICEHHYYV